MICNTKIKHIRSLFVLGLLFSVSAYAQESFGSFADDLAATSEKSVAVSGTGELDSRLYVDGDRDNETYAAPSFMLGLDWQGDKTDFNVKLALDEDSVGDYPEDVIDEMTIRAYLDDVILESGKMKVVWGKGDKLHVLDNFNANDYTDFIVPDYIDRRIAEKMIHAVWNSPQGFRLEAVYTPTMTADRFADSGVWVPGRMSDLTSAVTSIVGTQAAVALSQNDAESIYTMYESIDSLEPDTGTFGYGQAGLRMTATAGAFDYGLSYYAGHYKQVSVDWSGYEVTETAANEAAAAVMAAGGTEEQAQSAAAAVFYQAGDDALPELQYDALQVFGLEGAAVFGMLNTRAELGYYLTDDTAGDDPWVHNNSFNWLLGFDMDLPVHYMNLNIQETGKYILNNDKIEDELDTDYDSKDRYSNNKLVTKVSDSFLHEKLELSCTGIVGIEYRDIIIQPKAAYDVADGLNVALYSMFITGDDNGEYASFHDNSLIGLDAAYSF